VEHIGHYAIANSLLYPVKEVLIGGEFQFGRPVHFSDGFNANDYETQSSFKYDVAKVPAYW